MLARVATRPHADRASIRRRCSGCSTAATPSCATQIREVLCRPGVRAGDRAADRRVPRARARVGQGARRRGPDRARLSRRSTAARATRARTSPRSRRSRFGDLSLLVKFGVQFGLWGGAVQQLGTERHHERYLKRDRVARAARLLRDDRGRPRLQRPAAADDRHATTPRREEFVIDTPDERGAQGVHRQRRLPRPDGGRVRAADRRRRAARRPRARRPAARRARRRARRRADRGLRREDGAQRRRQRPDLVRPRPRAARRAAQPLRRRQPRGRVLEPDRERRTSASSRCSGRSSRAGCASPAPRSARPRARSTIAVRYGLRRRQFGPAGRGRGRRSSTTAPTSAG